MLNQVDQTPASKELLLRDLDEFLERDRDRALFDLAPKPDSTRTCVFRTILNTDSDPS